MKLTKGTANGAGTDKAAPGSERDLAREHPDPHEWIKVAHLKDSSQIEVPKRLIDQVLGQETAVAVAMKAAEQRRHLLLIGDPGTGKSMLAKAMAEILPPSTQNDLLVLHNDKSPNEPKIIAVPGSTGRARVQETEARARRTVRLWRIMEFALSFALSGFGFYMWYFRDENLLVFLFCVLLALLFLYAASQKRPKTEFLVPKLLIEHERGAEAAPYVDGTGAHAGALLGDVRHDPYQSGGLETPPHVRVEVGAIHRAHQGVLFIDEINVLRLPSQQALLTALQEGKYSIVGQSQSSAGAMVKTAPVPCEFILVAAGNLDAVQPPEWGKETGMHPALRSRIRGYGYEVYVNNTMTDTHANRLKLAQFVAQEVTRDGKIPHFDASAIAEVIREAQRRSGQNGRLSLRLRELGGLVRTAGDYARDAKAPIVGLEHVRLAKVSSRSLEQQITEAEIQRRLNEINLEKIGGEAIGFALGAAFVGTGEVGEPAGLVVRVEAAFTPALSRHGGSIVLGHRLKKVPDTGVENVGAIMKTLKGTAIADYDLHVDATINHPEANAEGIGVAAAVASVSAFEKRPVRQDCLMVGTIGVGGELRPVRSTLQQLEAGIREGLRTAIVPEAIRSTLLLDDEIRERMEIIFCSTLDEVLKIVLSRKGGPLVEAATRPGGMKPPRASAATTASAVPRRKRG